MPARLEPRDDEWYEWLDDPRQPNEVFVQLAEHDDGRLHVSALHLGGPVSAETLRAIPVGRIEALANALLHPGAAGLGWRKQARLPSEVLGQKHERARGDEFYETVAKTYRHLSAVTKRPVAELAEANEVPPTTAHRWVKEARRRGMLPPGRPGKAG